MKAKPSGDARPLSEDFGDLAKTCRQLAVRCHRLVAVAFDSTGIQPKATPAAPPERRVISLMDALRRSIETETPKKPAAGQSKTLRSTARRKRA
jgi:hypothetical protein